MDGREFEELVRQTARWVWNLAPGEGASSFIAGVEIDCVCRTEDVIHVIECTLERRLQKVKEDTKSLLKAKQYLEAQGQTVKLWIVTYDEPTPDQQAYAKDHKIAILGFSQFRSRIVRAADYLNARWNYRFGSAADPQTGSHQLHEEEYVPLPLKELKTGLARDIPWLVQVLLERKVPVVLLGPFGAGKSLTIREVFRQLRTRFFKETQVPVAVALNLREHWGQEDSDEALRRHAARVGFEERGQLVRAWNAGSVVLLLDGFDELASQAWRIAPADMKKTRFEAVKLVRAFVKENQGRFGILLAGRDHYFDTIEEMQRALSLPLDAVALVVEEFTEGQAQRYLMKKGVEEPLPDWLPRKPLLLGYLASRGLLKEILSIDGSKGTAHAWSVFLDKICDREAALSKDIEGPSVKHVLENLAAKSRSSAGGSGPLFESDLSEAYMHVTGSEPLEEARTLLQRLPGLTTRDQQEGARSFVDLEMLDALRGSAVARFVSNPFLPPQADNWRNPLGELGCSIAALLTVRSGIKPTGHRVAAKEALDRWNSPTLAIDCLLSAADRPDVETFDCEGLVVKEGYAGNLDFEQSPIDNVEFQWCQIGTLNISDAKPNRVRLYQCFVDKLIGRPDAKGLPDWISECEIGEFDNLNTNAAIMHCGAPMPVRVLLTILRKLFIQRGRARKESAFSRGIDPAATKFVPEILELMRRAEIAFRINLADGTIWHPNRRQQGRVMQIVATLGANNDALVVEASKLM